MPKTDAIRLKVAKETITVLKQGTGNSSLPLKKNLKVAYIAIGDSDVNSFGRGLSETYKTDTYLFSWKDGDDKADDIFEKVIDKYDAVVIGIHNFSNRPANNYGITNSSLSYGADLIRQTASPLFLGMY
jgi:hypothetical protein